MDRQSSSDSNISLDSLEKSFNRKTNLKHKKSDDNVDTILVPFYENDVLIKVPKDQKRNANNAGKSHKSNEKMKKDMNQANSYLMNKDAQKSKRPTYLEMFRKQFAPNYIEKNSDKNEIRSLSPEFGDTERESIGDDVNNPVTEFYNTESYNEIYYEHLLNKDIQIYMDNSLEEDLQLTDNLNFEPIRDASPDNLRSVSEVSNPRRQARRATIQPIQNFKLGGLGPDIELIKPRLERARSLQRYSEKVRMENRLKIYKKNVQAENDKKLEREMSAKLRHSGTECKDHHDDATASYLVNKTVNEKNSKVKSVYLKSKSADAQKTKERNAEKERTKQRSAIKKNDNQKAANKLKKESKTEAGNNWKASLRVQSGSNNKGINTEDAKVPPMQINFMVNVGGARPSSALKTLEEKHRMYQEQVKAFMDHNNG